jgi:hypothetical protein
MRRAGKFAVLGAAIGAIGLVGAVSAGATVIGTAHGLKYVQTTNSIAGGGAPWSTATSCGSGWLALSGGTDLTGQPGEARMTSSLVGPFHATWKSAGYNTNFGKNLSTVGLCRHDTAPIDYASTRVAMGAGTPAKPTVLSAGAHCPANRIIASGGVQVEGNVSDVHVSGSYPVAASQLWRATVVNTGAARHFTVKAECLPAGAGLTYSSSGFNQPVTANGFSIDMPCPTSATIPISGGLKWGGSQAQVHIANSGPIDMAGWVSSIPDVVWRIGTNNDAGATKLVTAYVICKPA